MVDRPHGTPPGAAGAGRSPDPVPAGDAQFLALLVHRGILDREQANGLLVELGRGAALDGLLASLPGWTPARVDQLRRTGAGERPEIPGHELLERIGQGGTADVWAARERRTGRELALKILRPKAARHPATLASFIQEAKWLERLEHPALVRGFGVARVGELYLSRLELLRGATALERLDRGERFGEEQALRVVLEIARALAYLEQQGIVHRDVKPGNILCTRSGRNVLIDLGFATRQGTADRSAESAVGTVAYLSPEQARGGAAADVRSDVYSLGVSLFQLVLGRLPFEGDQPEDVLRQHIERELASAELRRRGISPHLHYFVGKMTAKDPADRFASFAQLIAEVEGALKGRDDLDFRRPTRPPNPQRGPRR